MSTRCATTFAMALVATIIAASVSRLHAEGAPTVMKLSTATLNDSQHEWMKRFVGAVERDSGGRIKGEIYPGSQLGSIPRQIEGVQFGSIQGWIGPPEFLVGVDARYEVPSAPGLIMSQEQDVRVFSDPAVRYLILGLGANKGLTGVGIFPFGPSSIVTRRPVRHLVEFQGLKVRMSASSFQLEMIKRMKASPMAMSLGDVLPAIQQGAIDAALTSIPVDTTLHYVDAAKYVTETGQPWINSIAVLSRKWLDSLPADLQTIVRDDAMAVSTQIVPFVNGFSAAQRKVWTDSGGELISLPAVEQQAMIAQISSVANDLSTSNPELNAAVKIVFESAARNK
jgi:TRAP-type transport system periplasmic protein